MTESLPITVATAKSALRSIIRAVGRMPQSSKALWKTRLSHIYGEMGGQRGVELSTIAEALELEVPSSSALNIIIGIETYFAIVCNLFAIASLTSNPSKFFSNIATFDSVEIRSFLNRALSGEWLDEEGFYGSAHAFDFAWLPDALTNSECASVRKTLSEFAFAWVDNRCAIVGDDPLQKIHHALFPKNLLHITGQFYTPPWLAELLLDDLEWTPDKRIIDPFCGSGVFLLAALAKARKQNCPRNEILNNICGIDLSPTACISARANIVLYCAQNFRREKAAAYLNVICADALAPSIVKGRSRDGHQLFDPISHQLFIDGESVDVSDWIGKNKDYDLGGELRRYGMPLKGWIANSDAPQGAKSKTIFAVNARDRRIVEQLSVFHLEKSEFLVTNPPWVGWEYISRPYREAITPAWLAYDLFKARGLNAAFLKEDLSSLALLSAWDLYLRSEGKSAVVLRPAIMRSDLTARGVRRLSLGDNGEELSLTHIRDFSDIRVFSEASAETATWQIEKGRPTSFPVRVSEWSKRESRWSPEEDASALSVRTAVRETTKVATRTIPDDKESRWLLSDPSLVAGYSSI